MANHDDNSISVIRDQVGVEEIDDNQLSVTRLEQNFPNPFKQMTDIGYQISEPDYISIKVYNIAGKMVRTLVNGVQEKGTYNIIWRGESDSSEKLPNGVYFYRLNTNGFTEVRNLILIK